MPLCLLAALVAGEHLRLVLLVDVGREVASLDGTAPVDDALRDDRLLRLRVERVERVERVLGVRLEAKHLATAQGPGPALGAVVARVVVERLRDADEVTEAVVDRLAAVDLDAAQDVGVVADHHVRARVDRGPRDLLLVVQDDDRRVDDALVERDGEDVTARAVGGRTNVDLTG